jgi:hypothetical protein
MKINGVRAMLIVSLVIILLYILGLFLPIIKNTKNSMIYKNMSGKYVQVKLKNNYF